ncbi:hypothetical protein BWI97_23730 [Siphonobacter sp. BAB-5405]|nr:FecR family protein [Siphonobacter sp. BAB-5405]PMD90485.1 hypothetical protein BWI97_23730 [Siphonobacter sp. BAB-5405]
MNAKSFTTLIKRLLAGHATPEEKQFLEQYDALFDDPSLPRLPSPVNEVLGKELFSRIQTTIQNDPKLKRLRQRRTFLRVASVIASIGAVGMAYLYRDTLLGFVNPIAYTELRVKSGQIAEVTLADGTHVTLNAGSMLRYPSQFKGTTRQVELQGEGFFNVVSNPKQPFQVQTSKLNIRVVGTQFNVRSYPQDAEQQVAVTKGKVQVSDPQKNTHPGILLTAQQKVTYALSTGVLRKGTVEGNEETDWMEGILNFKNKPFREVAAALERRFAIEIRLDPRLEDCSIYAKIGTEPVESTLKALTYLIGAELQKSGTRYSITGSGCPSS